LRGYPVDHFDVYQGHWQQRVLDDQLSFLSHVFARPVPPLALVTDGASQSAP